MCLIDTGVGISLLQAKSKMRGEPSSFKLFATNDTYIDTFGDMFKDLGFRCRIQCNFIIAAVPYAIVGADILEHYGLVVELQNHRLVYFATKIFALAVEKPTLIHSVNSVKAE